MIAVNNQRIRLALDLSKWQGTPTDVITSSSPTLACAADLQFELAFSYGDYTSDSQVVDVSNWASLTLSLKSQSDPDGLAFWSNTIAGSTLNNALTYANWTTGTDQAAVVPIGAAANTLFLPTGSTSSTFQIVISALTNANLTATTTASFSSGVNTITVTSGTGISVGQIIAGSGITLGTRVTTIAGTTIGLSVNTTGSSSGNYTFTTAARRIPIASFPVTVDDTGISSDTPTAFVGSNYYTQAQSDARYVQLGTSYAGFALLSGSTFTGAVILESSQMSGATGLYATTKTYVDAGDAAVAGAAVPNTGTSTVAGLKTFSSLLTVSAGVTVSGGSLTVGSLSGVLKAASGVVAGSATTSDLTEGSNLYFTTARTLATALTGYSATSGTVAATDTVLQAFQKLGYAVAHTYSGATLFQGATTSTLTSASSAKVGDIGFITGTNSAYFLTGVYSTLANWIAWPYPVASVNGATGTVVLTTDNVTEGSTNLYYTDTRADARAALLLTGSTFSGKLGFSGTTNNGLVVNSLTTTQIAALTATNGTIVYDSVAVALKACIGGSFVTLNISPPGINSLLTGFSATGGGTVTSSDSILTALQKHEYLLEGKATFTFQGSSNIGLVTNQLTTSQIGSLSVTSASYGALVYDTTLNVFKGYSPAGWLPLLSSTNYLPLSAGSGNRLTSTLYFNDGLTTNIYFGNNWNCRTSSSNANFDILNNSTVVLTCDSSSVVHAPNGWFDTPGGYRVGGNNFVTSSSSRNYLDFGGNFSITTSGSFAGLVLGYSGSAAINIDGSNNVQMSGTLTIVTQLDVGSGSTKTIDSNHNYYDNSGNRILSSQQGAVSDFSAAGGWSDSTAYSDFLNLVSKLNNALAVLRAHGLMAT